MAATITVGTNSWVTEAEANTFFDARLRSSDYWTDDADDNIPALITAYKWLNSGEYDFPTTATQNMKDAQCEEAFFLLQQQPDIDLRMGLQVQNVLYAGVVKEKYKDQDNIQLPTPVIVKKLLASYSNVKPAYFVDIARNPEESVDYDAFGNRLTDTNNDY